MVSATENLNQNLELVLPSHYHTVGWLILVSFGERTDLAKICASFPALIFIFPCCSVRCFSFLLFGPNLRILSIETFCVWRHCRLEDLRQNCIGNKKAIHFYILSRKQKSERKGKTCGGHGCQSVASSGLASAPEPWGTFCRNSPLSNNFTFQLYWPITKPALHSLIKNLSKYSTDVIAIQHSTLLCWWNMIFASFI
jgi:hypothetical protein